MTPLIPSGPAFQHPGSALSASLFPPSALHAPAAALHLADMCSKILHEQHKATGFRTPQPSALLSVLLPVLPSAPRPALLPPSPSSPPHLAELCPEVLHHQRGQVLLRHVGVAPPQVHTPLGHKVRHTGEGHLQQQGVWHYKGERVCMGKVLATQAELMEDNNSLKRCTRF